MRPTYLALFLAILGTGMGLPVPEDAAVLTAGAVGGADGLAWGPLLATCMTAVLLGDLFLYGVGWALRRGRDASGWLRRVFPDARVKQGEDVLRRHGDLAIVIARFVMGVRGVVFVAAGALGRPITRVIVVDLAAAAVHVPLLLVIGRVSGDQLGRVTASLEHGEVVAIALVVAGASAAFSLPRLLLRLRQRSAK